MIEVDARGLSCPEPVILTMNAMKENADQPLRVTVSNSVARDNVCSLAKKRKRTASAERVGDDYVIDIK
jgi:tRNA 2-thiouridine synthesizing protein A